MTNSDINWEAAKVLCWMLGVANVRTTPFMDERLICGGCAAIYANGGACWRCGCSLFVPADREGKNITVSRNAIGEYRELPEESKAMLYKVACSGKMAPCNDMYTLLDDGDEEPRSSRTSADQRAERRAMGLTAC